MIQLSSFNWFRTSLALKVSNSLSLLIDFTEIRPILLVSTVLTFKLLKIYPSNHAQKGLFNNCAGSTQGAQLHN